MYTKNSNQEPIIKDDNIDLIGIVKTLWNQRKTLYYSLGIALFIGILIAFASTVQYSSSAILLPSAENKSNMSNLGALAGMASMAGINIGGMMGSTSGIPPELYPQVIKSYPFLHEFIHEKFNYSDYKKPVSIYEYVNADTIQSFGAVLSKYTIELPWTIKNSLFQSSMESPDESIDYGVLNLSFDEYNTLLAVKDLIQVDTDDQTGLVTISVETDEPLLSAQFAQKAVDLLQKYIIEYKTKQVRQNLEFIQQSYDAKKLEYEQVQKEYLLYKDQHRNVVSERTGHEFLQMSERYDMVASIYKTLAQQLEQAKISVNEETPAFSVIEPPKIPFKRSSPNRKVILVISVFLGGLFGLIIIFWKHVKVNLLEKWNKAS